MFEDLNHLITSNKASFLACNDVNKAVEIIDKAYSDILNLGQNKAQKQVNLILAHKGIDEIIEESTCIPLIIEYLKLENIRIMKRYLLGLEVGENE